MTDVAGKPQPGAMVVLLNRQDRFLQRSATDALGSFAFGDLLPDLYSIQVSLPSFVPAIKDRIQIKPGMRSLLEVNLSRVFSSVQLVSTTPAAGRIDERQLEVGSARRQLHAADPALSSGQAPRRQARRDRLRRRYGVRLRASMFSDSRGLVKISASDGAPVMGDSQADLGTQFAFATSVYGGNRLQVAGDVGYGTGSAAPSGAFRTTYSRDLPMA